MVHPAPDGLIGDHDPAFRQQIFDVAEAQCEPNIEPDHVLDDFGRKAIAAIADFCSSRMVRLQVSDGKPAADDKAEGSPLPTGESVREGTL
jgi:hypothetical protein